MAVIKRWAFWPLLALVCVYVCVGVARGALNAHHASIAGTLVGLALSVPVAIFIDWRRQRRWAAGRPRRLFP